MLYVKTYTCKVPLPSHEKEKECCPKETLHPLQSDVWLTPPLTGSGLYRPTRMPPNLVHKNVKLFLTTINICQFKQINPNSKDIDSIILFHLFMMNMTDQRTFIKRYMYRQYYSVAFLLFDDKHMSNQFINNSGRWRTDRYLFANLTTTGHSQERWKETIHWWQ